MEVTAVVTRSVLPRPSIARKYLLADALSSTVLMAASTDAHHVGWFERPRGFVAAA
jgi:hypothetical protein